MRQIANEGTKKKNKYAVLWTKREKSYERPPQLLANYKAVCPLVGDAVESEW